MKGAIGLRAIYTVPYWSRRHGIRDGIDDQVATYHGFSDKMEPFALYLTDARPVIPERFDDSEQNIIERCDRTHIRKKEIYWVNTL